MFQFILVDGPFSTNGCKASICQSNSLASTASGTEPIYTINDTIDSGQKLHVDYSYDLRETIHHLLLQSYLYIHVGVNVTK
jgi:hypothetical protein